MILDKILAVFILYTIITITYIVITLCVDKYLWYKLKRHVIEAIEELNLWNDINTPDITCDVFLSITKFLDSHKYKHCFYEKSGAFRLYWVLGEIRKEHENQVDA